MNSSTCLLLHGFVCPPVHTGTQPPVLVILQLVKEIPQTLQQRLYRFNYKAWNKPNKAKPLQNIVEGQAENGKLQSYGSMRKSIRNLKNTLELSTLSSLASLKLVPIYSWQEQEHTTVLWTWQETQEFPAQPSVLQVLYAWGQYTFHPQGLIDTTHQLIIHSFLLEFCSVQESIYPNSCLLNYLFNIFNINYNLYLIFIFADLNLPSSLKLDSSSQKEGVENNRERIFIYR